MNKVQDLVKQLTLEEKAYLLCGSNPMSTHAIERLNIPSLEFSDGPHGVRKLKKEGDSLGGIGNSLPTTCFPTAVTSACSFNPDNLYQMGKALGEECLYYNINVLLGPAINIQKNVYNGRNFEYFSEDPFLAGTMGTQQVKGVQQTGVGTSLKHFACNNNERYRMYGDSIVDERALREIYLRPFQKVVKEAQPATLMCAYNKVNGTFCSENKYLLQTILRDEWGFKGSVMSDWGAVKERDKGVEAGLDLEMPGSVDYNVKRIVSAVNNKSLSMERVDQAVINILNLIEKTKIVKKDTCDFEKHNKISLDIAKDSAVLLKNDEGTLPLSADKKYLVIGDFFVNMRYQGSGSSLIFPKKLTTPKMAFDARKINYEFVKGYKASEIAKNASCELEAIKKVEAGKYDCIIFFGGQSDYIESEGFDRKNINLAPNQISLIDKLTKLKKKMVFVMFGGSPIEMPFAAGFNSILNMMLPGQAGGEAAASILFGETNPSGKLAQTWPVSLNDVQPLNNMSDREVSLYKDSIFVGYRYFLTAGIKARYPFGFGLSYSTFKYSDILVKDNDDKINISFKIQNTSDIDGKEISQIYVHGPENGIDKPLRELKGFKKIQVKARSTFQVDLSILKEDLKYYDAEQKCWVLESGEYAFEVGKDCENIVLRQKLYLSSKDKVINAGKNRVKDYLKISDQDFAKRVNYTKELLTTYLQGKYTVETPLEEFKTFGGKLILKIVAKITNHKMRKAEKMKDGPAKEAAKKSAIFLSKIIPSNSLRSLCFSAGGLLTYKQALGLVDIANNHFGKGIVKLICKKD